MGPELEIPGYGCEDHFQEMDTVEHSWECLTELLTGKRTIVTAIIQGLLHTLASHSYACHDNMLGTLASQRWAVSHSIPEREHP